MDSIKHFALAISHPVRAKVFLGWPGFFVQQVCRLSRYQYYVARFCYEPENPKAKWMLLYPSNIAINYCMKPDYAVKLRGNTPVVFGIPNVCGKIIITLWQPNTARTRMLASNVGNRQWWLNVLANEAQTGIWLPHYDRLTPTASRNLCICCKKTAVCRLRSYPSGTYFCEECLQTGGKPYSGKSICHLCRTKAADRVLYLWYNSKYPYREFRVHDNCVKNWQSFFRSAGFFKPEIVFGE